MISPWKSDCAYFDDVSAIETGPFVVDELTTRPVMAPAKLIFRNPRCQWTVADSSRRLRTKAWVAFPKRHARAYLVRKLDASANFLASTLSKTGGGNAQEEATGIFIIRLANPLFQGLLSARP